jgi:Flp pilus assembly protein TadG
MVNLIPNFGKVRVVMASNTASRVRRREWLGERGTALLEAAVTIPMLLLIAVGIFDFGRAYQTWQVLTNAAREGARLAVLPNMTESAVQTRARDYMYSGQLTNVDTATVDVNRNATIVVNGANVSASQVTVQYPFSFIALQPVALLVSPSSSQSGNLTMVATALMRNEQ